jgi:hypothetical protein
MPGRETYKAKRKEIYETNRESIKILTAPKGKKYI